MEKLLKKKKSDVNRKETKSSVRDYCTCEKERGTYERSDILVLFQFCYSSFGQNIGSDDANYGPSTVRRIKRMHDLTKLFESNAKLGEPPKDSDRFYKIGTDSYMHTEGLRRAKHLCGRQPNNATQDVPMQDVCQLRCASYFSQLFSQ